MSKLKLFNRADGVDGHYCIGRSSGKDSMFFMEYWNDDTLKFESAGTVIVGEYNANAKMELIAKFISQEEKMVRINDEKFIEEIAKLTHCLPSYFVGDNGHIIDS
jgi:hypothetical protein